MNPALDKLHQYPFERLKKLKQGISPADKSPIMLSIGEPKHLPPPFIGQAITDHLDALAKYPLTNGTLELRQAIAAWLSRHYQIPEAHINPERHILPVNGTREALFAIAQTVVNSDNSPLVLMPNPFYQIYEGAAILAGAKPCYLPTDVHTNYIPDFSQVSAEIWQQCQLIYICSPGNPTGHVIPEESLHQLINLAAQYHFVIAADECYAELYADEQQPPPGLLQVAHKMGNEKFEHCLIFNSLSKRSNVPGLRSGFVAGDAHIIRKFHRYRTYHGCAMSLPSQYASIAAWNDEVHVRENRALYREKFKAVSTILAPVMPIEIPPAGFFLWPIVPDDDETFTQALFKSENVTVLPGSYLSRAVSGGYNPGKNHIRIALVACQNECTEAAERIKSFIQMNY